jgi:hypothetical protein
VSDADESAPAVWDPAARDGAGGWVRHPPSGPAQPAAEDDQPTAVLPPMTPPRPAYPPTAVGLPRQATPSEPPTAAPVPTPAPAPAPAPAVSPAPRRRPAMPLLILIMTVSGALLAALVVWGLSAGRSPQRASGPPSPPPVAAPTASAHASASASASASDSVTLTVSSGPSASGSGQTEAAAVDQLLGQSADSRQQVVDAVAAVQQCVSPGAVTAAQTALTQAAGNRRSMVTQLTALDVAQVPGGAAAVQVLARAWTESAAADNAYANWAGAMAMPSGGCTPGNAPATADFTTAQTQSGLASADKSSFVDLWTPIAMQYGLPTRTADAI